MNKLLTESTKVVLTKENTFSSDWPFLVIAGQLCVLPYALCMISERSSKWFLCGMAILPSVNDPRHLTVFKLDRNSGFWEQV